MDRDDTGADSRVGSVQFAHAAGPDWGTVTAKCAAMLGGERRGSIGFLYATEPLAAELQSVLTFLRERTGVETWVGAVGTGICATGAEYFQTHAAAALVLDLPPDAFRLLPEIGDGDLAFTPELENWLADNEPPLGIVHADPRTSDLLSLVPRIAAETNGYLVGGLTSANANPSQIANTATVGGVSGVLLSPQVAVATGLTQGCTPIGPSHRVTSIQDNVILELDERPALEVFKEDIGDLLARDLRRVAGYIQAALPVAGSDTGDYLVRNLTALDPGNGWLAVAADLNIGDHLFFVRRDAAGAIADMERMLDGLKARTAGRPPKAALYHTCLARGPNLFGPDAEELRTIQDKFGDIPLVGFFGNGEISHDRLYSYTGVLTLLL